MSFFTRFLGIETDPREELRPLWHRVVEISREPHWYAEDGAEDSVSGRFDMITAVLALVIIRMEEDPEITREPALITELFVEDMDRQLRETGVGDLMVGKHIGKLVSVLGGRLGALRKGLAESHDMTMTGAVERNITMTENASPAAMADALRRLNGTLADTTREDLLAGRIVT